MDMLESITSHPFIFWMIVALLAGIAEVVLPSFSFVFVSVAAFFTAFLGLAVSLHFQLISFGILMIGSVVLLRPYLVKRFHLQSARHKLPSRTEELKGCKGLVTVAIDPVASTGRVQVAGGDWAARASQPIAEGKPIVVRDADGILLIVEEI